MRRRRSFGPRRRSWASRLGELLVWTAVAIAIAVFLVLLTERLAPPNF
jgi:hypothetical protein